MEKMTNMVIGKLLTAAFYVSGCWMDWEWGCWDDYECDDWDHFGKFPAFSTHQLASVSFLWICRITYGMTVSLLGIWTVWICRNVDSHCPKVPGRLMVSVVQVVPVVPFAHRIFQLAMSKIARGYLLGNHISG